MAVGQSSGTEDAAARELLRHTVATVAYRGGKVLRGAPASFATFKLGRDTRTPIAILAHINDLFDWAWHLANGEHVWHNSSPDDWDAEVVRFHAGLGRFDDRLADGRPLGNSAEALFQGPVADALTHIGQLALLRRRAGSPVRGENYFKASIAVGHVGADQPPSNVEFD